MKIIIDTNILISAIIRDRNPEKLILWVIKNKHEWIVTNQILNEYISVLKRRKFNLSDQLSNYWIELILCATRKINANIDIVFNRDQKDSIFIECLLSSDSDYFITGDKDFEDYDDLLKERIIKISDFIEKYRV